jgi:hypothetical protein
MTDLNLSEYETVPDATLVSVEYLLRVSKRLGDPKEVDSKAGWRLMDELVRVWGALNPEERDDFLAKNKEDRKWAVSPKQAVKENRGIFTISWPKKLYSLVKVFFPKERLADRKFIRKFAKRYPQFKVIEANV